ncbi:MAG: helix-turn-helix transcriptional regulator [Sphaerochaetaceae bacterium]|jgi:hypothetical protein|nr:helix-turn-helix transcriptional regulator [Sphaerochaetaceae bacterium]MDD3163045.1 helix-turn-helix transcriptional regulator [Sphaerochaetaceae bacterium]MDD4007479.1 helix-turn-helix transcriptional regulator [Sphaerochaetaceae bacterium]MDD4397175.1 helix-turn-helix transcriptional regulator [Sphaerochaetaceae bacterium]
MENSMTGMLLRSQRLRKGLEIKEVCSGICSPGYLCKIELGKTDAAPDLIARLANVLDATLEEDPAIEAILQSYFHALMFDLDHKGEFSKLEVHKKDIMRSLYFVDYLLAQGFENRSQSPVLTQVYQQMTYRQKGFFHFLSGAIATDSSVMLQQMEKAHAILQNSFSIEGLLTAYFFSSLFVTIIALEKEAEQLCLRDGNIPALVSITTLIGSCYSSTSTEMMMKYYQRALCMAESSKADMSIGSVNYNIGSTLLQDWCLDEALPYLENSGEQSFLTVHKMALLLIRQKKTEEAKAEIEKLKTLAVTRLDQLLIEEAQMECIAGFEARPESLSLALKLQETLLESKHLGFLIFFRKVLEKIYCSQRNYKQAYLLESIISEGMEKGHIAPVPR